MSLHHERNSCVLPFSLSQDFRFKTLLGYDAQQKTISLLGEVHGQDCIIISEKTHFPTDSDEAISNWISLLQQPNNIALQQVIVNTKSYMFSTPVDASSHFNLLKMSV